MAYYLDLPSAITAIHVALRIVDNLCAITMHVRPIQACSNACWTHFSLSKYKHQIDQSTVNEDLNNPLSFDISCTVKTATIIID